MDPRTGRPIQGLLSVAVLAPTGTAGDALDNAFFVMGPERSRAYLKTLPGTEAFFFLPGAQRRPLPNLDATAVRAEEICRLSRAGGGER